MRIRRAAGGEIIKFGMRNLMLEADLVKLEASGIEIGHNSTDSEPAGC